MNGPHDVGGLQGFGPIGYESENVPWHHEWEGRVCGMNLALAAAGVHVVDEFRYAVEKIPYDTYYRASYFERWLYAVERILEEKGRVTRAEIDARMAEGAPEPPASEGDSELAALLRTVLKGNIPDQHVEAPAPPQFAPGDMVRTLNLHEKTHLRMPNYVKRHTGVIHAHAGTFNHPRWMGLGGERRPAHLYTVRFTAEELWGEEAERPGDDLYIDLFEDYLEPADATEEAR